MELLTTIAVFLSPYLVEAGKTVATETVKTLIASRQDLAEKFKDLFKDEIITLGLNENSTVEDTTKQLETNSAVKQQIAQKIENNRNLLNKLTQVASWH